MMLEARKSRILQVVVIAGIVLASTLLLSACAMVFRFGSWAKLVDIAELILGVIIAAALVLLGTFGAISKSILAIPFVHRPREFMLVDGQTTVQV